MMRTTLVLLAALVACIGSIEASDSPASERPWTNARSTFFGRDTWSLHTGSCGYGFICPDRWGDELASGLDTVAVPDHSELHGKCGECLEVRCRSAGIPVDGQWDKLDRRGLCLNDKIVKVKITDTCPCKYPNNAASNARWCCGDYPHLDMSQFALEKITKDTDRWGVFAIQYRRVDCKAPVADGQEAPPLKDAKPDPHYGEKPRGLSCAAVAKQCQRRGRDAANAKLAAKKAAAKKHAAGYWKAWWSKFQSMSYGQKNAVYRKIWSEVKAEKAKAAKAKAAKEHSHSDKH